MTHANMISFNCKSIKRSAQCVRELCETADIIALQETWLLPYDLDFIGTIDERFNYTGISSVDLSAGVLRGRPYGGLTIMWRKSKFINVKVLDCGNDRIIAVCIELNSKFFIIFNVYMPTDEADNLIEFTSCLGRIFAIVEESDVSAVYVLGDFNAHPGARFGIELMQFCNEQQWLCADILKLGCNSDTFTFLSDSHGSRRWLDHCVVTPAAYETVVNIDVLYNVSWSDHYPLRVKCDLSIAQSLAIDGGESTASGVRWGIRDIYQIERYQSFCNKRIVKFNDNFTCNNCDNNLICDKICDHYLFIEKLYNEIILTMQLGAKFSFKRTNFKKCKKIPGWNVHVRESYDRYRFYFTEWVKADKPSTGDIFSNMVKFRKSFKNKLRWCQKNVESIKLNNLATFRNDKNFIKFWREVKKFSYKSCLPTNVDGLSEGEQIANLFSNKFKTIPQLFNNDTDRLTYDSNKSDNFKINNDDLRNILNFTPDDITKAVAQMKRGKSPGHDELSLEHVLFGGRLLHQRLCNLFNLCMQFTYLPHNLMKTIVTPIVKNRTGDLSSSSNYRPISLGTIVGKILERLLQPELLRYVKHDDSQFGFRTGLSTDLAIFSLKQTVNYYTSRDTSVYACFLDLSKAFDLVNYEILWAKLKQSDVPDHIIDLLRHWYANQTNVVKWGNTTSNSYRLECGVRQGGLTSPDLFNVYVNGLMERLRSTKVGCNIGGVCVNSISYADDMVLLSPSISGLRKLLSICEHYANAHGLKYNVTKTEMLVFKSGRGPEKIPPAYLNGQVIRVVDKFKYLGHVLTGDLRDDSDMERERRALSVRCNMISRKFSKCSDAVKITLFKSFCQNLYTCQLWSNYSKKSFTAIRVQYNDAFRILFKLPRYCSASHMFAEARVPDFYAVIRSRIASFWERLRRSDNSIVQALANTLPSNMFIHWLSVHHSNNIK